MYFRKDGSIIHQVWVYDGQLRKLMGKFAEVSKMSEEALIDLVKAKLER